MVAEVEYDSYVDRPNSATVAVFALLVILVVLALGASEIAVAQINGPPASVTSAISVDILIPHPVLPRASLRSVRAEFNREASFSPSLGVA